MTAAMLTTMLVCFALTVSVAVSIGLASILGIQVGNANMLISVKEMFNSINKFPLAAIPFFILAGNIMETGGISRRLVEFAKSLVGGVQGGHYVSSVCVNEQWYHFNDDLVEAFRDILRDVGTPLEYSKRDVHRVRER